MDIKIPHDSKIEENLLAGLIQDPNTFPIINAMLPAGSDTFYFTRHQDIYKGIEELVEKKEPFDVTLLHRTIQKINSDINLSDMLVLIDTNPTGQLNEVYANNLTEIYMKRNVINSCTKALDQLNHSDNLLDIVGSLEKELADATTKGKKISSDSINDIALNWWEDYLENEDNEQPRIMSGWRDLDKYIALMPGTHVLVGARTSIGKTSWAINLATNVCRQGKRPAFFTMEQTKESVATCYIAQIANVDRYRAMTRTLTDIEKKRIMDTAYIWGQGNTMDMAIYDGSHNVTEIRHKVLLERINKPVDMIIVDFIHNMKSPRGMQREGHEWLRETAKQLEELSIELNLPIVTLAQVNRKVEDREDKRPFLADIREAGEDNADIVCFIYRDEYYFPESTTEPGIAEIIIAKNRHGKTGTIKLKFISWSTAFIDKPITDERKEQESWTNKYD